MKTLLVIFVMALVGASAVAQQSKPAPRSKPAPKSKPAPITGYNFQWTPYQNGSAELSLSLRNNTKTDVKSVKYRVIFYGRNGDPIHFEDGQVFGGIPAGLAVQETINIVEGGLNLYHSTTRIKVQIISFESK